VKHWCKSKNKLTGRVAKAYLKKVLAKAKIKNRRLVAGYVSPVCPCV